MGAPRRCTDCTHKALQRERDNWPCCQTHADCNKPGVITCEKCGKNACHNHAATREDPLTKWDSATPIARRVIDVCLICDQEPYQVVQRRQQLAESLRLNYSETARRAVAALASRGNPGAITLREFTGRKFRRYRPAGIGWVLGITHYTKTRGRADIPYDCSDTWVLSSSAEVSIAHPAGEMWDWVKPSLSMRIPDECLFELHRLTST
jgi:hypothetical protein